MKKFVLILGLVLSLNSNAIAEVYHGIDIDAVYNAVCQYIGSERMPVSIPVVGLTVKIGRPDVDALYRYIKGA